APPTAQRSWRAGWAYLGQTAAAMALVGLAALAWDGHANAAATPVRVVANQLWYTPNRLVVPSGGTIRLTLSNDGWDAHDFEIDGAPNVHLDARPGQTTHLTFTTPAPGTYRFWC